MLIWMRNSTFGGALKFLLLAFMTLAVAGLVLTDVGGFFKGTMGSNTVAKGAGVKIGIQEFDRTVRRALGAQGIGAAEAYQLGLIDTILNSEIQNRLFTKEAKTLGLEVGDDAVKLQISKLAEPLATDGRSKKEALQQILRTQNISEGEFIGAIRQEMANGLLRGALSAPATLTSPLMAQSLYRYDNEKRSARGIILRNTGVSGLTAPTDEQLQKYYEANKQDFLIPETRTITMATLKTDMLKKNVKISDEQLKAEYDKNIASFTKPPRRLVEQVTLPDEAAAKAAAEDMKAGKTVKDSNTQEFEEAGLLPEIGAPVFAASEGAVVGPIQTSLGWHVLKVKSDVPESVVPFAEVKDRLRDELSNISLTEELYSTGNAIEDRAAGGDKLEDIVSEYGMTTEIIGPFRQNGRDKDGNDEFKPYGADREKIIQSAYDFEEGEIAPVVETADGQFHLVRVDQVIPDSYRDFASVKSSLESRWMDEQRGLANAAKAKATLDALNAGKSLDDVAEENGTSVQSFANISRKEAPAAPLTPIVAAQIFTADKGGNFSAEIENGYVVGTVTDISLPASAQDKKELTALEDLTGRSLTQDILGQYITALSDGKPVKVNKALLDQVYGQQAQ